MSVVVVTPPASLVELDLVKKHLRVDGVAEDVLITLYVAAACGHIDGPGAYLGRSIGVQVLELTLERFPVCGRIALPFGPVISVESVTVIGVDGVEHDLAEDDYRLVDGVLLPPVDAAFPVVAAGERVRVRWRAGYAATPPAVAAAVLLMSGDLYRNRETVVLGSIAGSIPMSTTVENLLRPFRVLEV